MDRKRKRMMTIFIEATDKLMSEDRIDGLSIRKIATEAGYNSATIYYYFENLEHLILFASVRYLREYTTTLSNNIKNTMSTLEKYKTIYSTFNYYAFRSPEIFHNMFFGKYSSKLSQVITQYYELFPDDLKGHDELVVLLLRQGNMYSRDEPVMKQLVNEGYVNAAKANTSIELLVNIHQSYIYKAWLNADTMDPDELNESFLQLFDYIMAAAQ